jgi:hypothetical protein
LNKVAWALATSSDNEMRDGVRAVALATKACELTRYKVPKMIDTLAAAYAETGDFDSAIKWSEKALAMLDEANEKRWRPGFSRALENYRAKMPMRQHADRDGLTSNAE